MKAVNNSILTPVDYSTAARAPVKSRAMDKHFADHLATEQARVEAELKRLEAELEQTRARFVKLGSDSDSRSDQSLLRKSKSFHGDNEISKTFSISPPTTIGGIQNNIRAIDRQPNNESMITKRDFEQFKTELQDSFELLLAYIQQMVSAAVAEQIKALTSDSQKFAEVTNVASPIAQTSGTEGRIVAPTNQTVTAGLDGLSTASTVLTVCSAIITTATVPMISHVSSRAVSVMTSAGLRGPIMTVISTSGSVASHLVKETASKIKVNQAVKSEIATVASEVNAAPNIRPRAAEGQFGKRIVCLQCGLEYHYRKDCQANGPGNERDRRQDGHRAGQFQ